MSKPKVIMLGLDGATWSVLNPLIAEGRLPTLKKLKAAGVWGTLESTLPPVSGPAWVSLATGKNPGKTGVFDFLNRRNEEYDFTPASSKDFSGQAFWDYLSQEGVKVGILNYPLLYPPYPINGFMVSGLLAPEKGEITYPQSLKADIDRVTEGYKIDVPYYVPKYTHNEKLFIEDIEALIDKRYQAARFLITTQNWDLFMVVFSATDLIQHYLWKDWDQNHPKHPAQSKNYKQEFCRLWSLIDEKIGCLLELPEENVDVLMVSDHGFGPQYGVFFINQWFKKAGFLNRKPKPLFTSLFELLSDTAQKVDSWFKTDLFPRGRELSLPRPRYIKNFDLNNTKAFAGKYSDLVAGIFTLQKDQKNNRFKKEIKHQIEDALKTFARRNKLEPFDFNLYRKSELYSGPFVRLLPDLILEINGFEVSIQHKFASSDKVFVEKTLSPNKSGTHKREGVFIATGPHVKNSNNQIQAGIYDIAPTILKLFDLPIPKDIDGQVLSEIFESF